MAYGILKVDTVTFTDGGIDKSVSISGLVQNPTFSGNITVTGTISGNTVQGQTVSGVTVTGTTANFTSGVFTNISGGIYTITSGVFAAGSAANPSISFTSDPNTGLYSPGADQLALSTNGTERLRITSAGLVGIGTSSPAGTLNVQGTGAAPSLTYDTANLVNLDQGGIQLALGVNTASPFGCFIQGRDNTNVARVLSLNPAGGNVGIGTTSPIEKLDLANGVLRVVNTFAPTNEADGAAYFGKITGGAEVAHSTFIALRTSGSERARIDSIGRLLVGTSTSFTSVGQIPSIFLATTSNLSGAIGVGQFASTSFGAYFDLVRSNSGTVGQASGGAIPNNEIIGGLRFNGSDGATFRTGAEILATADGQTWASADCPTRLVFSTTADGASSPTERIRITSEGNVGIGATSPQALLDVRGEARANFFRGVTAGSQANASRGFRQTIDGTEYMAIYHNNSAAVFEVNSAERARIDSSGRLLVGTSSAFISNAIGNTITCYTQSAGTAIATASTLNTYWSSNVNGSAVNQLAKSRGALGVHTVVQSGDRLGVYSFAGSDGSSFIESARIEAAVDGTPGANDMPGRLVFSTTADGASSPTERMIIFNDGRIAAYSGNGTPYILSSTRTAGSSDRIISLRHSATSMLSATESLTVRTNGNVENTNNSYGALSDIKLKENIVDANPQWSDIKSLQVRNYNFKEGQTHTQIGLVAQEVELVSPGLVTESPDRDEDGNDLGTVTKSVNYSVLYMKAVKALQEAMERIETLEQRLNDAGIN